MLRRAALLACVGCWLQGAACGGVYRPPMGPYLQAKSQRRLGQAGTSRPGGVIDMCKVHYRNATLDHFSWAEPPDNRTTFQQRYYICDAYWNNSADGKAGPIFFYVGNEADVTLYLNATGLMWESAPEFGALLVFAEHRYYGKSKPFGKDLRMHMQFLTSEQALADYAELLTELKTELDAENSAVIGFGGSYGGMLATWMRIKYPHILDGSIAGSAPIWSYLGEDPPFDSGSFAAIVTRDASPAAGSAAACAPNVRKAWDTMFELGKTLEGRDMLRGGMRICPQSQLDSAADASALVEWAASAWDYLAMGDYPYPSTYILNGGGELPAYPVRVACSSLEDPGLNGTALLGHFADAIGLFYNYTGDAACYDFSAGPNPETEEDGDFWGYQWCTEQLIPSSRNGKTDMYWDEPFDLKAAEEGCQQQWGVTPRPYWANVEWGGRQIQSASNIVFSNGLLDPWQATGDGTGVICIKWHGGGVLQNISDTLVALVIPEGAHHIDLMFSNPLDPPSVIAARATQRAHMRNWIDERRARQQTPKANPALDVDL